MSTHNKTVQYSTQVKMKWWYLPVLILGFVVIAGGVIWVFIQ